MTAGFSGPVAASIAAGVPCKVGAPPQASAALCFISRELSGVADLSSLHTVLRKSTSLLVDDIYTLHHTLSIFPASFDPQHPRRVDSEQSLSSEYLRQIIMIAA